MVARVQGLETDPYDVSDFCGLTFCTAPSVGEILADLAGAVRHRHAAPPDRFARGEKMSVYPLYGEGELGPYEDGGAGSDGAAGSGRADDCGGGGLQTCYLDFSAVPCGLLGSLTELGGPIVPAAARCSARALGEIPELAQAGYYGKSTNPELVERLLQFASGFNLDGLPAPAWGGVAGFATAAGLNHFFGHRCC